MEKKFIAHIWCLQPVVGLELWVCSSELVSRYSTVRSGTETCIGVSGVCAQDHHRAGTLPVYAGHKIDMFSSQISLDVCKIIAFNWWDVMLIKISREIWHHSKNWLSLRWRHNDRDSVSNHQPHDCLLDRLFRHRLKKTSKLRVTGLCAGNSPGTGEFPAQRVSYAENVSIWWRDHVSHKTTMASWKRFPHYWLVVIESGRRWIPHPKDKYSGPLMFVLVFAEKSCWTYSRSAVHLRRGGAHMTSL